MTTAPTTPKGPGCGFVLCVVLGLSIVLKLTGVTEWGWFWVLWPIWILPAAGLTMALCSLFFNILTTLFDPPR